MSYLQMATYSELKVVCIDPKFIYSLLLT